MFDELIWEIAGIKVAQRKIFNAISKKNITTWNGRLTAKEIRPAYEKIRKQHLAELKNNAEQNITEGFRLSE